MSGLNDLLYRIAHQCPGAVPALAARMGKNPTVLMHKLNPNNTTHHLTVEELESIADFVDANATLANYFSSKCNAVVVPLPVVDESLSDMALLDLNLEAIATFGDLARDFQKAFEDGRVTLAEWEHFNEQGRLHISAVAGFMARVHEISEKR